METGALDGWSESSALHALGPLDGCLASERAELPGVLSEASLMWHRTWAEVQYLTSLQEFLCEKGPSSEEKDTLFSWALGLYAQSLCRVPGRTLDSFTVVAQELQKASVVFEQVPGWKDDTRNVERFEQLPQTAQDYINMIEDAMKLPVQFVSVAPARGQLICSE